MASVSELVSLSMKIGVDAHERAADRQAGRNLGGAGKSEDYDDSGAVVLEVPLTMVRLMKGFTLSGGTNGAFGVQKQADEKQ